MVIYLDILFLYNFFVNTLLLYASGYILKLKIRWLRLVLAGGFGALYGIFTVVCKIHPFLNGLFKLLCAFVMVYLAYRQSLRGYIRLLCTLFLSSFCLCGFYMAFSSVAKLQRSENMLFLNLGYPYIFLIFLLFLFLAFLFCESCMARIRRSELYKTCEILHNGKSMKLCGFVDTGNNLYTPEGVPVAFVNKKYLLKLFKKKNPPLSEISFSTVGGQCEQKGFFPDKILIDGKITNYFVVPVDEDFENNFDILLGGIECLD